MRLEGRHLLVTGAARGIGRAFAQAYAREGARVAIADIDIARARRSAARLADRGQGPLIYSRCHYYTKVKIKNGDRLV